MSIAKIKQNACYLNDGSSFLGLTPEEICLGGLWPAISNNVSNCLFCGVCPAISNNLSKCCLLSGYCFWCFNLAFLLLLLLPFLVLVDSFSLWIFLGLFLFLLPVRWRAVLDDGGRGVTNRDDDGVMDGLGWVCYKSGKYIFYFY